MKSKIQLIIASLVGALALHGALVACSAGSSGSGVAGEKPAYAGTSDTPACAQWEVRTFAPAKFGYAPVSYVDIDGKTQNARFPALEAMSLEPGWEPLGDYSGASVLARHCLK
ncbi:MAG: hypothetical protein HOO96_24590 [Polyangiaceae bacterium]|nr:hypothetical protein [Polyangiaceae bacterium]